MADNPKEPYGPASSAHYADPGYQKDGKKRYPLSSEKECRAAWSYINMPKNQENYTSEQVASIKGRIKAAAKKFGITISEDSASSMDSHMSHRDSDVEDIQERPREPIEYRDAKVEDVDFEQRIITVIAAPYESPARVLWRKEWWEEVFERGAFDSVKKSPNRVRVNRDHNRSRTIGKVVRFDGQHEDGLVADVRIARTPLGDETLALASDDCLSASVGYAAALKDTKLDRSSMTRRVRKAYLDHLAFVEDPAYTEARVLSVRQDAEETEEMQEPIMTPYLDQFTDDEILRWAAERLSRMADKSRK